MATSALAGWLLTFALHSTVLLGLVWLATRLLRQRHERLQETLWQCAVLGGLFTASLPLPGLPVASLPLPDAPVVSRAAPETARPQATAPALAAAPAPCAAAAAPRLPAADASSALTRIDLPRGIVAVAALLAAVAAVAALRRRWQLWRTLRARVPVVDPLLHRLLDELLRAAGSHRTVRLTQSNAVSSPIAFGLRHPEICVPPAVATLTPAQLRSLLAHELAHLLARDPWWLALLSLLQCLFPWQVLLRVAGRRLRTLAEYRCDAWAAQQAGSMAVAQCLVEVADWLGAGSVPAPVAGMAVGGSVLGQRVERLLAEAPAAARPHRSWHAAAAAALLLGLAAAAPRAEFAPAPVATSPAVSTPAPATASPQPAEPSLAEEFAAVRAAAAALEQELAGVTPDAELSALIEQLHQRLARLERARHALEPLGRTTAPDAATELASRKDR